MPSYSDFAVSLVPEEPEVLRSSAEESVHMNTAAKCFGSGDAHARLALLGLTVAQLHDAIEFGDGYRQECEPGLDPASLGGFMHWGKSVRRLRETLIPLKWRAASDGGLETVVSDDESIALAVCSGDEATGDPERTPQTRYPKGPSAIIAVLRNNNGQGTFKFDDRVLSAAQGARRNTWMLLIFSTEHDIRAELSLPRGLSTTGRKITSWFERIALPPIVRDGKPIGPIADDEDDIDFDVKRRTGS